MQITGRKKEQTDMKNMKKTLCLLLAVLMTVSLLAGCG